jgi:hypothetical protein
MCVQELVMSLCLPSTCNRVISSFKTAAANSLGRSGVMATAAATFGFWWLLGCKLFPQVLDAPSIFAGVDDGHIAPWDVVKALWARGMKATLTEQQE